MKKKIKKKTQQTRFDSISFVMNLSFFVSRAIVNSVPACLSCQLGDVDGREQKKSNKRKKKSNLRTLQTNPIFKKLPCFFSVKVKGDKVRKKLINNRV